MRRRFPSLVALLHDPCFSPRPNRITLSVSGELSSDREWCAQRIAETYWEETSRAVRDVVRTEGDPLGPLRLRICGRTMLGFERCRQTLHADLVELGFPIVGGFAAAHPHGELVLRARRVAGGVLLESIVEGYTPRFAGLRQPLRLLGLPWYGTQRLLHRRATRRALHAAAAELVA